MALENYRITEFQEKTQVDNGDYVLIDSATDGTHKYQLSRIPAQASAEVAAAVAAEETAREAADAAEVTARNAAISAAISDEVTARNAAIAANVDNTLTVSGKAADAKKTGDEIADLKSDLTDLQAEVEAIVPGLSDTAKEALLACFEHIGWKDDDGEQCYTDLYTALYGTPPVPPVEPLWEYDPAEDGLLSIQSYVTSSTISGNATENISNNKLSLYAKRLATTGAPSAYVRYVFGNYDNIYGAIKITAKITSTTYDQSISAGGYMRIEIADQSKGAQFYIQTTPSGKVQVRYNIGSTQYVVSTQFDQAEYHEYTVIAKGNVQKLLIDNTEVVNVTGLSESYVDGIRIWAMSGAASQDITATVSSIKYYDEE